MLISYKRGQASVIVRVKIRNSSVTTGAGLTGLTNASSGLIISTIADNEATATVYTVAASNVETITTLGTYAAPTVSKCRFKEVDATNHPGVYELQFADARFNVSSAKSLLISISGATNAAQCDVVIPLRDLDPYSASVTVGTNNDKTGYTISGTITTLDGLNNISTAQVNAEVDTALADINLDHLVKIAVDTNYSTTVHNDSVIGHLSAKTATANYSRTTDSLEALFEAIDAVPTAAEVWSAGTRTLTGAANITSTGGTITVSTGAVTVGTNNDKTGYSISGTKQTLDALNDITAAAVNAEVLDVLATDTFAEPSGVPAATSTLKDKLNWVFILARNKLTETATTQAVRNDADNANVATAAVSDDGTTFTRAEWA